MPLNLPNLLTCLRIILIPLFVGIFYFEKSWVSVANQNLVATVIFVAAAVTALAAFISGYAKKP